MTAGSIHPDLIHPRRCQRRPNGWVHPCPIQLTFGAHARHPPYRLVVQNPRRPSPAGGSLPTYLTQTEAPLAPPPHKISLPFSYPIPPSPKASPVVTTFLAPAVGSVPPRPIVVRGRQRSSQVLELRNCRQRCPIRREDPNHIFFCLCNNQPMSLPLRPALTHR